MPVYYEFGPVSEAGRGWANWNIGSFEMPTAWFDSMNGLLCIILCPVFAGIWAKMRQRPQGDWGMFTKTALGIIVLGLCTASMVLAAVLCGQSADKPVGIWVIVLASVCMSVGEVIFSPLETHSSANMLQRNFLELCLVYGHWSSSSLVKLMDHFITGSKTSTSLKHMVLLQSSSLPAELSC